MWYIPSMLAHIDTSLFVGKTIAEVESFHYGSFYIHFTDGSRVELSPSGTPPTIFVTKYRRAHESSR